MGVFDWELVADSEAVIAGFTASCYAASATGGGGLSSPHEVAAFLHDYEEVRGQPLSPGGDGEQLPLLRPGSLRSMPAGRWR